MLALTNPLPGENRLVSKIFAREKPGATSKDADEEEALEEEQADERQRHFYDEEPLANGWKVSGTIQNNQSYQQAPFINEIIQVTLLATSTRILQSSASSTKIDIS